MACIFFPVQGRIMSIASEAGEDSFARRTQVFWECSRSQPALLFSDFDSWEPERKTAVSQHFAKMYFTFFVVFLDIAQNFHLFSYLSALFNNFKPLSPLSFPHSRIANHSEGECKQKPIYFYNFSGLSRKLLRSITFSLSRNYVGSML